MSSLQLRVQVVEFRVFGGLGFLGFRVFRVLGFLGFRDFRV